MALPGIRGKELRVGVQDGVLTVTGTRSMVVGTVIRKYRFIKCFALEGENLDLTRVTADYSSDSTLVVTVPKLERATPLQLELRERPLETIHECWEEAE